MLTADDTVTEIAERGRRAARRAASFFDQRQGQSFEHIQDATIGPILVSGKNVEVT